MTTLARQVWYAGASLPSITATLRDDAGDPIAYGGTETVEFLARSEYGVDLFRLSGSFVSGGGDGRVVFNPATTTLPADTPLGVYDLFWAISLSGKTEYIPAGQFEVQAASVASGPEATVELAPYALTSLEAVKEELGVPGQTSSADNALRRRINQASAMIMVEAEQEFRPLLPDTLRLLPVRDGVVDFSGNLSAAPTLVRGNLEATPVALAAATYELVPSPLSSLGGGYRGLRLLRGSVYRDPASGAVGYVEVTGDWGWTSVPADIERVTIMQVINWSRRDLFLRVEADAADEQSPVGAELMPSVKRYLREHYKPLPGT